MHDYDSFLPPTYPGLLEKGRPALWTSDTSRHQASHCPTADKSKRNKKKFTPVVKSMLVVKSMQQLKSHKDFAKLFEKPEKSQVKDKENSSVGAKNKKSSSGSLSPTKKSSLKSNQSSTSKSSRSLRSSLLSKPKQSSELASHKTQASSKAKAVSGTKEHPIVLSSGESDHEAPLPSLHSQTKEHPIVLSSGESDHEAPLPSIRVQTGTSEPKKNTIEQPVEKPKATIKPFQIKKPLITQTSLLGEPPGEDQVAPVKKHKTSLPPVEKQPAQQVNKVSESTSALAKCQRVAPSQKKAEQPTKQIHKPPPVQGNTITRPKWSLAKAQTKKVISPIQAPGAFPPPPRPPPSFSLHTRLQAQPYYVQSYGYQHSSQAHFHKYQGYNYSHCNYPIGGGSSASSYPAHPLATSYSASYYQPYY